MRLIASWCRKLLIAPGRLSHNINIPHPKEQGADKGSGRRALRKERDRIRPRRGRKTDRGDATFTAVCGGSAINVLAIAEAGAFLAAAAFGASLTNVVLLSVLTVYSVASGNEQKLMTYVSLLSTALLGLCVTYGAYGEVTVSGDKGSKTISTCDYENICKKSVHNQGKNKVMLGKYDGGGENSYITKAGQDYEYFSLGDDWEIIKNQYGFDDMDMFKLFNEPFLDNGINAGKIFYFSHNPQNDGGALGLEFNYLKQNQYIWDEKNMSMSPKY